MIRRRQTLRGSTFSAVIPRFAGGHLVALVLAGLFFPPTATSQVRDGSEFPPPRGHGFVHTHWTTADGLPQGTVNDILEASDGRIWLATWGGLVRFDGNVFDVLDIVTLPALGSNRIVSIEADTAGGLWVVTEANSLVRIEADTVAESIPIPSRSKMSPGQLYVDSAGVVSMITGWGVLEYAAGTWRSHGVQQGLSGIGRLLTVDSDGRRWIGTDSGIFTLGQDRYAAVDTSQWLQDFPVQAMWVDGHDRLWIGTEAGLALLDRDQGVVRSVRVVGSDPNIGSVTAIGPGRPDELWVGGTRGLAHLHIDPDGSVVRLVAEYPSMDGWPISKLTRDSRGNTWIGSRGDGLARLAPRRIWHVTRRDGLPVREVRHITGNGSGGVWLGGGCQGLASHTDAVTTTFTSDNSGLENDCVSSLFRDRDGIVWVGAPGYLTRIEESGEMRTWSVSTANQRDAQVAPIVQDSAGRIWFGYGRGGLGFVHSDMVHFVEPIGELAEQDISSMTFTSAGELWVGQAGRVLRLSIAGDHVGRVETFDRDAGVPPGSIRFLYQDRSGDLWVGSYGGGLARCEQPCDRFRRITTEEGLPDNSISGLIEDERERFWILGNRGVSVVHRAVVDSVVDGLRARVDAVVFDYNDGLPEGNGGHPAAWIADDGMGWFGTIDGLVAIDTRAFPRDTLRPVPRVDVMRFGGADWTGSEPIVIGGGPTEVEFRYSASSTINPSGNLFRYRLRGQDDHWVYVRTARPVRYPRVPPGQYLFAVEARNVDGLWSAEPAIVEFQVLPLWWQTRFFQWGTGLLAVGLIGAGLVRRVRRAEFRSLQLSRAIQERDRAEERSRRWQRDLEHVARVAAAGELTTSLAHELNQPLMAIVSNAAAGNALLSNPDMGKEDVREALDEIVTEGKRASEVIKSLREFLGRGSFETEPLYPNQLVRDVLVFLNSELRETKIDLRLNLAGDLPMIVGNRVQLQQVLANLVLNAIDAMRHRDGEHRLIVTTRTGADGVEFTVRDNGPGLESGEESRIFEPFVTTKTHGMGVGLAISRTLVGAHGGKIRASNHPDGGAEFVITLPVTEVGPESSEPENKLSMRSNPSGSRP
jgi:signal transduction histidine kinase/ligand-binding sensor domain-containing protein